jgi:predicted lipoprotein with Yx(FWY)xxD motif
MGHSFSYLGTTIPAGVTIREYRAQRAVQNSRPMWQLRRAAVVLAGAAVAALVALAAVGCGGGDNGAAAASAQSTASSGQSAAVVATASEGNLGTILVDSKGRTLYLFKKDSGTKSACSGACATAWPPLRANGKPSVAGGADASLIGTTTRSDGKPQVTYNGHPLYLYQGDEKPGDTEGQGSTAFGAAWYVLSAAGHQVSARASSSTGDESNYDGGSSY